MNYVTQVQESLAHMQRLDPGSATAYYAASATLASCRAYLIPPPRSIKATITYNSLKWVRPKFPEMVFEYDVPDSRSDSPLMDAHAIAGKVLSASSKRVTVVLDLDRSTTIMAKVLRDLDVLNGVDTKPGTLAVLGFYWLDEHKMWSPAVAAALWDAESEHPEFYLDGNQHRMSYRVLPIYPGLVDTMSETLSPEALRDALYNDIHEDLGIVIRMLALLNARNLEECVVSPAPKKLNSKRARNGHPPFVEYHTLKVFISKEGTIPRLSRMLTTQDVQRLFTNGRKFGEVEGHFKLRKTGMFWWGSYLRGNPQKGRIVAQHKVETV